MNTLTQTDSQTYTSTGEKNPLWYMVYNNNRNHTIAKERMPLYTGNLVNFLGSGNEDQQAQISDLWRSLSIYFRDQELKDLDRFPMHTFFMDDGTISVEWHFRNMAVAFDIEEDTSESGWSLSSTREAGQYSIGGYLTDKASIDQAVGRVKDILRQQWDRVSYAG